MNQQEEMIELELVEVEKTKTNEDKLKELCEKMVRHEEAVEQKIQRKNK